MSEHLSNYTTPTIGTSQAEVTPEATDPISIDFVMAAIDNKAVEKYHFPAQEEITLHPYCSV